MPNAINRETGIGLVKLRVSDLKRSITFYEDVVGLKLIQESNGSAELSVEGAGPLLILEEMKGAVLRPRRSGAGLYHFAILLPDRKSLGLSLRNLVRTGIHIGQADHLVSEALYIADPDNNGIEIYRDRPRGEWQRDAEGQYIMAVDPIDWDGLLTEAGDEPWSGLPAGTIIGHIHLHVSDLTATRRFYHDVLGFDITSRMGDAAMFVSAGGYHHHIGLNTWAGAGAPLTPKDAAGLSYYVIELPDQAALQEVLDRLKAEGYPAEPVEAGTFAVLDPSGIEIHLAAFHN
ncbi:VOC family protein [Paenibacillus nasutitermitis]|uniref:Catechol-2,3-dioxygenase n=1 Tax=Paenibacillus nasutitermitis TaxID=1652958 RepID=A0A917DZQ4_9BACL|nr:VOC family protein [Paenibacillus nasutitermitis]GGD84416.1 catechol-2,3-dioxygenase [Paenibacillus nasutitermitis]